MPAKVNQFCRAQTLMAFIVLSSTAAVFGGTSKAGKLDHLRCVWVGQYPTSNDRYFLSEPEIKAKIVKLIGKEKLASLKEYRQTPIDYVSGYYLARFSTKTRHGDDGGFEWVDVIVREYTGSIHIVMRFINTSKPDAKDEISQLHSDESDFPPDISRILELR